MSKRPIFTSRLTTLLTMIGVAIGLGNVWRFPYMMGQYGGSAFLFIYLLFTILFAVPALVAEMGLGRTTRQGTFGAFSRALGPKTGNGIGYLLLLTILVASSYYIVVIANVIYTAFYSAIFGFHLDNIEHFEKGLGNGWLQYGIVTATLILCLFIIQRGLNKGVEWFSKIIVPFFLLAILYLIWTAFSLEGAKTGFFAFLRPDFAALEAPHIFAALGQAFFSLSLGGTFMLTYGSYLKQESQLPKLALWTAMGDVGAALLASLFIVPTVLVFGLDMAAGPKLIFSTLPRLFAQMPGGQWVGALFLFVLALVAILSMIAALEVLTASVLENIKPNPGRKKTVWLLGVLIAFLALFSSLNPDLIGILDLVFGSGMQVIGSGLSIIALTWGLGKVITLKEVFGTDKMPWQQACFIWVKWVIPAVLLMVLIGYIYSLF